MKLSRKKLLKLRSGQTVHRVWFFWNSSRGLTPNLEARHLVGKRVIITRKTKWGSTSTIKICENYDPKIKFPRGWYLLDLAGDGCFSSAREAQRFVKEVQEGLHPGIIERAKDAYYEHLYYQTMIDKHY